VCIHFGHQTKKNGLDWSTPWEAALARLELHGRWPWEFAGEEGREWGRGAWGAAAGGVEGSCGCSMGIGPGCSLVQSCCSARKKRTVA
jgi:hypothetical protein